jgi:hypothetical protein
MRGLQLQFFASPAEQQRWLTRRVEQGLWCCIQRPGLSRQLALEEVSNSLFEVDEDDGTVFYVGNFDIAPPQWREANGRVRLDHVRSGAIQFAPGIFLSERKVLLEGRLAHPDVAKSVEAGLLAERCEQWFRELCATFRGELGHAGAVLTQRTSSGKRKEWREVWITPGASEMHAAGVQLKQFADGAVEFSLVPG